MTSYNLSRKLLPLVLIGFLAGSLIGLLSNSLVVNTSYETPYHTSINLNPGPSDSAMPRNSSGAITFYPADSSLNAEEIKARHAAVLAIRKNEEEFLEKAIEDLSEGRFFHNIPEEMRAGHTIRIDGGIAENDINELLNKHAIASHIEIISAGFKYNPLETELELKLSPSKNFDVESISSGPKPVLSGDEPIWSWRVTPLKRGSYQIFIIVKINFVSPVDPEITRLYEPYILTKNCKVRADLIYSLQAFFSNDWKDVVPLLIGSTSVLGAAGFFIRQHKEKAEKRKEEQKRKKGGTFIEDHLEKSSSSSK